MALTTTTGGSEVLPGLDPHNFIYKLKEDDGYQWSEIWGAKGVRSAYLAGPMRGYAHFNYPLFNAVADYLRSLGYTIYNPAESDGQDDITERALAHKANGGNPLDVYMEQDLADVAKSDAVFVLPGWEQSEGAGIEVMVALMLGHPVYELPRYELIESGRPKISKQTMPSDSADRKATPLVSGVLDYFPAALAEVARVSKYGNDKHNPGEALHWSRNKSNDHADAIGRHLIDRGEADPETGMSHTAELAWRALALLQVELEEAGKAPLARGASV